MPGNALLEPFTEGLRALRETIGAADAERVGALAACETLLRQVEQIQVELIAGLDRDGVFAARGYRSAAQAVGDLLGWDYGAARRRARLARGAAAGSWRVGRRGGEAGRAGEAVPTG
jgi:hypothetical protein